MFDLLRLSETMSTLDSLRSDIYSSRIISRELERKTEGERTRGPNRFEEDDETRGRQVEATSSTRCRSVDLDEKYLTLFDG